MKFYVIDPDESYPKAFEPIWVLTKDRWDDFGFKTQYHLNLIRYNEAGEPIDKV